MNTAVCAQLQRAAAQAGVRRRFVPHQLRHAHTVGWRAGVTLIAIQRHLAHTSLGRDLGKASTPRASTPSTPDELR